MAIEITSNTILKPSVLSSPHPLTTTLVPLTIFDLAAMDLHVPTIYAFRAPMPSNLDLKEGLSKVLYHYPHLSGRMTLDDCGQPCFILNNAGVRLIETRVSATLAEKLPLEATTELTDLHPPVEGVEELLQVQLNRYTCGSLVIGVTSHHRVADGQSMSQFLVSWADTLRNSTTAPTLLPFLDRASTSIPRNPPRCEFNHLDIEFKENSKSSSTITNIKSSTINSSTTNFVVRFSSEFIGKLKSKIPDRSSTFECLLAHLWKKITIARGLEDDELTQVRIAVNGRTRIRPAVPMQFFGNLVLWAYPKARGGELTSSNDISHAVNVIRGAVSRVNDSYFKSFIDFGEILKGEGMKRLEESAPESGSALCPNLEVDSWLRFNFHDLDFGSGGPCAFLPPNLPVEGLMVFVPSCKEKGGVDVFMALFEEHVEIFKNICYCLD